MNKYYDHTCACGCGGRIEKKKCHKYNGVPKYKFGHNSRTWANRKEYYDHTCYCGCGGKLKIRKWHSKKRIPKYLNSHNSKTKPPWKRKEERRKYTQAYQNSLSNSHCVDCGKRLSRLSEMRKNKRCQLCAIHKTKRLSVDYTKNEYSRACKLFNYQGVSVKNVNDGAMKVAITYIQAIDKLKNRRQNGKSKLQNN